MWGHLPNFQGQGLNVQLICRQGYTEHEDQEKGRSAGGAAVGQGPVPLSPGVARPLSRHGSQRNLQLRLQG